MSRLCSFYAPPPKKWRGIMLYPLKFWVFVCPSVRQHPHHSSARNSTYSFRPILFRLYRCFRMVWRYAYCFFRILKLFFISFFCIFNLDFFQALILQKCTGSMYLLPATPPTVLGQSFSNFTGAFRMVRRYAYCFFSESWNYFLLHFLHF